MTLSEVAKEAGVAASTVSRYLRGQLKVQDATRDRIDEALRRTGYRPPSSDTSDDFFALIVPELANPFYAALAEACVSLAAEAGMSLLVSLSGKQAARESRLTRQVAAAPNITGLIYAGMNRTNRELRQAIAGGLPTVILDEDIELGDDVAVSTVTVDNYAGAYQATRYLTTLGHRRIAHIGGPAGLPTSLERTRGYRDAMGAAGLEVDPGLIFHGPYTERFGASVLSHLMTSAPAPTAVFVASDIVAIGLLGGADLQGVSIPRDLSVVGCDGIRTGEWVNPRLTTLVQPVRELATEAMAALESATRRPGSVTHQVLPLQLVVRDSAIPLAGDALSPGAS
ncbi:LacI family DNA-binding transcriptional regulator [Georgenia sp. MJ170]|uniref:LacI family DNA-binding transcriptional regulator n=1 Tax=Georgenia sunbinii TaxID=3117728 RepID=UPI002F264E82